MLMCNSDNLFRQFVRPSLEEQLAWSCNLPVSSGKERSDFAIEIGY